MDFESDSDSESDIKTEPPADALDALHAIDDTIDADQEPLCDPFDGVAGNKKQGVDIKSNGIEQELQRVGEEFNAP